MNKKITIIIPVKPGGAVAALENASLADYPPELYEIIVAEGCRPSLQRNRAAAGATGEILYFIDDDSRIDAGNLKRLATLFADPAVAAVGGPSLTPRTDNPWQQAFGLAFASRFGGGGVRNRYRRTGIVRETCDRELILCNLAFRSDVFRRYEGFDERLYPNEENELLDRIREGKGKLVHDPDLVVYRSQRSTFGAFLRQMYGYGRGRGEQTLISRKVEASSFLPALLLLYFISLLAIHNRVYYLPVVCYALSVTGFALSEAFSAERPALALRLLVVFPALHLAYGAGVISGILRPRFMKMTDAGAVSIKIVK